MKKFIKCLLEVISKVIGIPALLFFVLPIMGIEALIQMLDVPFVPDDKFTGEENASRAIITFKEEKD